MSNYIKTTNFTAKDSLPSGNPSKIVRGTEIDAEFDAIAVASATKLNALNPVMTGTLTVGSATLSEAELEILDGATVTTTELNYVDGVTSSIQTQLNNKLSLSGGAMTGAITTNSTFDGRDVATDGTKLDGIEASADVTDTANVTAAGALMDSEVTNLAQVKAFDSTDYATAAQGTLATAALPKSGGAMTGAITTNSTFDGVDIATRDGVLTSTTTTANAALPKSGGAMTGAITTNSTFDGVDIATRDAVLTTTTNTANAALPKAGGAMTGAITTNSTFDGRDVATDGTKLDGIEASADVTDTTNVVASLTAGSNITIAADGTIASTASGGGGETLAQTLALGNTTGGTDLVVSTGDSITLPDGAKIKLGDEPNLEISHSGTHSIIEDVGGGSLFIKGGPQLKLFNDGENAVLCQKDAGVTLYHNNIAKVVTTATGLSVTGTTVTDAITIAGAITEDAETLTGTSTTIDLATATNFVHDLTGATTYTFSNPAATGNASSFTLKIIQDATARTITWPATVRWAGGTAPTLSTANDAVDVFTFYTIDGGSNYYGFTAGQAMA